jgi:REP element-mobilizing transposase RayT
MARKYKFHDDKKLYFVTFTVVYWLDVFIRKEYKEVLYESIKHCQKEKGLEVYAYCIMTSHVHLIIGIEHGVLSDIVRDLKSFTSRAIRKSIEENKRESRREWLLWIACPVHDTGMRQAGKKNKRNNEFQFWQQHNHPIQLDMPEMARQRLNYIHNNPVEQGFVQKAEEWLDSSCADYYGVGKSKIELIYLE